ncbi:MAG: DUF3943 domain-containing protein [Spirochaetales bacterium]|jgi:hypothetical protein|nr:DUF3943 domain-containing protein [Spirochaetales bacterium]
MKKPLSLAPLFAVCVLCFFALYPRQLYAEEPESEAALPDAASSGGEKGRDYASDFMNAFLQGILASDFLIFTYDFFGIYAPYSQVNPATWRRNLDVGLEWDNSDFFTNSILHPYQGAFSYAPARAYGFSFPSSLAFAAFGSFMWEFFGERDTASINDFVVTAMGGAAFGESGHRLASALMRGSHSGARRFFREFAAFVVDPVYMVNAWVVGEPFVERNRIPGVKLDVFLRTGINMSWDDDGRFSQFPHPYLGGFIRYGGRYEGKTGVFPYDFFAVQIESSLDYLNPGWSIFGDGILLGARFFLGDEAGGVVGFFQQFDYLENLVYKMSANGAGAGLMLNLPFAGKRVIEASSLFYGIVIGALDSRYTRQASGNYSVMGPGYSVKLGLAYRELRHFSIQANYYYYWIRSLNVPDRENTVEILTVTGEINLAEDTSLGLEFQGYERWSDAQEDKAWAWSLRTYLSWKL